MKWRGMMERKKREEMRRRNGEMKEMWWRGNRRGMDKRKLWIGVWK